MVSRDERLRRAREIVETDDTPGLDYMIDDPLQPDEDVPVERYMLVTNTDHSCDRGDSWLEFVGSADEVVRRIANLLRDEWGLHGVWDLDAEDYAESLAVRVDIHLGDGEERVAA